jgi:hypothetical protein
MIYTVNRSYKITFTKSSGFTYTITSSKASVTNIKNPTGTVVGNSRTINTVMYLNGLDAYNNNVITVTAIDTLTGCTIILTDNLTKLNPCNNLLIDIDNTINTLTYKAIVTSGKQPYSYKWSFNDNFQAIGITTNDTLNLRNITEVTPFNVSVEVTDFNGCKTTKIVSYPSSCKPTINNITATNECWNIEGVMYNRYIIELVKSGCGNLVQELIPLDNSFIYSNRYIGDNKYELIINRNITSNFLQFYVKNNLGYNSNKFSIGFNNPTDCIKPVDCDAIVANDITTTLGSESKETITKINVIGDDVDYTTFKFIVVGSQSSTSNIQLNTIKGVATYNPTTREIKHTFNNFGDRGDVVIKWSISDKCGTTITKTLTIQTKLVIVPNVGGKQARAIKGKSSSINIDGVDNLTIIKNPTSGVVSTSSNTLTYNSSNIGVYDFELLPYNDGVTGLPFTTSYEVVSSGTAINTDFCTLGLINLQDYVSGASTGGNWYGVNNTVFISQSNQVNFTSVPIGSYQFQYVVTAGSDIDTTTVTFNKYSFAINSISVIPAQAGQFKVTINHTGLLIEDIITSVYILNGVTKSIVLDGEASATSFSFNVLTETITNLTYSINTVCGTKTISYVKPAIQVSTFNIVGKGIATATLTKQPIKLVSGANNIVGRGVLLTNPQLDLAINTFNFDADYLMIQYKFTDGTDLDTRTRIVSPNIGQDTTNEYIGFSAQYCDNDSDYNTKGIYPISSTFSGNNYILKHACDNQGTGFEAVLVNLINFKSSIINPTHYNASEITIDCRAWWYPKPDSFGVNKVKLLLTLWKGGSLVSPTFNTSGSPTHYTFTNPSAIPPYGNTFVIESDGNVVPGPRVGQAPNNNNGYRVGVIKYNLNTFVGTINNNDTTTPCIGSC